VSQIVDTSRDASASLVYVIGNLVSIRMGYRYVHADLESTELTWDGSLEGFSFGVGVHF